MSFVTFGKVLLFSFYFFTIPMVNVVYPGPCCERQVKVLASSFESYQKGT